VNGAKDEAKKQAGNAKDQAEQTGTSSLDLIMEMEMG
jgi:hypothetical protein